MSMGAPASGLPFSGTTVGLFPYANIVLLINWRDVMGLLTFRNLCLFFEGAMMNSGSNSHTDTSKGGSMSRLRLVAVILVLFMGLSLSSWAGGAGHRIGGGVQYWTVVDDVDLEMIDEDGVGWFVSYQLRPGGLLGFEFDVEVLPDDFAGARDTVLAPQAYGIVGDTLYAAVGVGIYYSDNDFAEDPFYILRAGINLELLPRIHFDVSGNYRFTEWDDSITRDIDTDTVTLAAAVRFEL